MIVHFTMITHLFILEWMIIGTDMESDNYIF